VSLYQLQKLIREINRNATVRERLMATPDELCAEWKLEETEGKALAERDYGALYRMGVHGLLLRPLSIIHGVAEPDYLAAIRQEGP
jgi:Aromatic-ring-opening dioxygenase LigAB, LigA subunit